MKRLSLFLILLLLIFSGCSSDNEAKNEKVEEKTIENWEIRYDYKENDEILFSIFPDPTLTAGKQFGYMFDFKEPFGTYEGKELAINVHNKETGERIEVLSPKKITEPSSGYPSLNRFTTFFEIPFAGIWKYEIVLDDKVYGDVVLSVK